MTCLCDTNIISELARPQPNPGVLSWSASITSISLSVITLEEITYGLSSKPNPRIQNWFQQFLNTCQIIQLTPEIAQYAGELRGTLRTRGIARSQADMLIAATA
jgi:predicted nucleic acid-binding protein